MNTNIKLNERIARLAAIPPASTAASTVLAAAGAVNWFPLASFHSIAAFINIGAMTATGTIDAKLRQAQDATGTGAKDIAGKAIAQVLAAAGSNTLVSIEARGEDLDVNNGFGFVALSVTVGTAASLLSAELFGNNARYAPAGTFNPVAVTQAV